VDGFAEKHIHIISPQSRLGGFTADTGYISFVARKMVLVRIDWKVGSVPWMLFYNLCGLKRRLLELVACGADRQYCQMKEMYETIM
jgi:hypothetical protein